MNKWLRKLEAAAFRRGWRLIRGRVYRRQVEAALRKPLPPVLVYQMAKVASRGVADALQGRADLNALHFHFCDPENSEYQHRRLFGDEEWAKRGPTDSVVFGRAVYDRIIKPGRKAFVITLVREPVGRNISSYFHNLNITWRRPNAHDAVPIDDLAEGLVSKHMNEVPLEWFDREFKPALGIDVYEHPFPREQGFQRISSGPYEVLVMRHDLDDRQKERCIEEMIGIEGVRIRPANSASEQRYAEVYSRFVNNVKLPAEYVSQMLDSKYTRHFYPPEEIERLRARWVEGRGREAAAAATSVSA